MADPNPVLVRRPEGLYCPHGDFFVDPVRPVKTAVISHGHADHARNGHERYHCTAPTAAILRKRLGAHDLVPQAWGEPLVLGDARVSFHPAGHVLGSAQIRIEVGGAVWVFSGDYKRQPDGVSEAFETVPCDLFITEATFALPVYRWEEPASIFRRMGRWCQRNREAGRHSVLLTYSLGKAQRVLHGLAPFWDGPAWVHANIEEMNAIYRDHGLALMPTRSLPGGKGKLALEPGQLILLPPAAATDQILRKLGPHAVAGVSGWNTVRGIRRRSGVNAGFALSDHADWPALLETIEATGAPRVWVTHGQNQLFARYLREERGLQAEAWESLYRGDESSEERD